MQVPGVSSVVFDRKQLAKDIMATISRLTDGKQFLGHDGRKYWIVSRNGKPESKKFHGCRGKGQWCGYNRCQLRRRADQDFPTMNALANTIRTSSVVQALDGTAR
jgi:hypothetical protein